MFGQASLLCLGLVHCDLSEYNVLMGTDGPVIHYGEEMWALYERGELQPEAALTGAFEFDDHAADVTAVQMSIDDARQEAMIRQLGREAAEQG